MSNELQAAPQQTAISEVRRTINSIDEIREFVAKGMKPGLDFGAIPGTDQTKKTLLLPGAQKAMLYFNCRPEFCVSKTPFGENGHVEIEVKTALFNRVSGEPVGEGLGSCSTMESKYRWRNAARRCPACGKEAIIKGKAEYGGGWLCFKKKDGCGAKFSDGDPAIEKQAVGKVENENIHDVRNTVLKIAKKRSLVDAALTLSCLSEFFTADMEQHEGGYEDDVPQAKQDEPPMDLPVEQPRAELSDKQKADLAKWSKSINACEDVKAINHLHASVLKLKDGPFKESVLGLFEDFAERNPGLIRKDVENNCWVAVEAAA